MPVHDEIGMQASAKDFRQAVVAQLSPSIDTGEAFAELQTVFAFAMRHQHLVSNIHRNRRKIRLRCSEATLALRDVDLRTLSSWC